MTQRPAKILHLHSTFNLGGKEARAVRLMNHFGNQAEHVVLSAEENALSARTAIDKKVKVSFPDDAPSLAGMPSASRYKQFATYMKRFDLILSYNWGSMDGVMAHTIFAAAYNLPPLVHHEDGFNEDEIKKLKFRRNLFRSFALARANALVVPSQRLEHIALTTWRQPQSRVHRISNGIPVKEFEKKPQRGTLPGFVKKKGEVVVGTLAGLRPIKNLARMVRSAAKAGDNVRLIIVGEGPDDAALKALGAELGMGDRLHMPGFLANPARYVGLFDVFALSSDSEQFPISLVEAMAAGLPVVATDVGDIVNMVSKTNLPYITKLGDEGAYEAAFKALAEDEDLRKRLGNANKMKAQAEYNEKKMIARYGLLYGNLIGRPDFGR